MKVYESSYPTKRDFTKVPQIKIKNSKLSKYGFTVGKKFSVLYQQNKIILTLIEDHKINN